MQTHQSESSPAPSDVDDRRQYERDFPRRRIARVEFEGDSLELQLLDESDGGVGLYVSQRPGWRAGSIVSVYRDGEAARFAEVRYVLPAARGGFQVGLQWT